MPEPPWGTYDSTLILGPGYRQAESYEYYKVAGSVTIPMSATRGSHKVLRKDKHIVVPLRGSSCDILHSSKRAKSSLLNSSFLILNIK